jgi:hypothetical protein
MYPKPLTHRRQQVRNLASASRPLDFQIGPNSIWVKLKRLDDFLPAKVYSAADIVRTSAAQIRKHFRIPAKDSTVTAGGMPTLGDSRHRHGCGVLLSLRWAIPCGAV